MHEEKREKLNMIKIEKKEMKENKCRGCSSTMEFEKNKKNVIGLKREGVLLGLSKRKNRPVQFR